VSEALLDEELLDEPPQKLAPHLSMALFTACVQSSLLLLQETRARSATPPEIPRRYRSMNYA
jgi:hypothetical protein